MSFGSAATAPALPAVPQLPSAAQPPMFGQQTGPTKKAQTGTLVNPSYYGSTVLGGGNPTNTGNRTLLGQ